MSSRYYFLSSLPMLRFSDAAPLAWEQFIASAEGNISAGDMKLLRGIQDDADCSNGFLSKWAEMNRKLSDSVNDQRRRNLGRDVPVGDTFRDYDIERITNAVMAAKNPLEAELLLMRFQYDWLENEKGLEPFTENAMLAYALQLRILIRKDRFSSEAGNSEYKRLFDIIQREI